MFGIWVLGERNVQSDGGKRGRNKGKRGADEGKTGDGLRGICHAEMGVLMVIFAAT